MNVTPHDEDLPTSATPKEAKDALGIADMRRAIMCGVRDSELIRECLEVAERHDLEEEEMYVWLAYQALLRMEEFRRACTAPLAAPLDRRGAGSSGTGSVAIVDVDGHF